MNDIFKKTLKEIARIIAAALLAALGIESTGCITVGDGSNTSVLYPFNSTKE